MKNNKLWLFAVSIFFMFIVEGRAQESKADAAKHEQKVRDMVSFLEFMLNTLGDSSTHNYDKDVLVTESYAKIFRDGKVQIEDDLVENRNVITNKDVQAYLKDVDFFFSNVKFEFNIDDIKSKGTSGDKLFYKVSLKRNLKGTTVDGKAINNTRPRYIEINYNAKNQDLKIVSIYTNEFDEKEALLSWWSQLSYEWQAIFKRKLNLQTDSVDLNIIKSVTAIEALDLSNNQYIQTIEPLGRLAGLQKLNLANTRVSDLSPVRNLTELVDLNLSNTKVEDLSSLRYSANLQKLDLSNTAVQDITIVEKLRRLEVVDLSNTLVMDFTPLENLTELQQLTLEGTRMTTLASVDSLFRLAELNVSKTFVEDLSPISGLINLITLNLDSTRVSNLTSLSSIKNLKVLSVNYTTVADLKPLQGLRQLEKIYCDHTGVNHQLASAFMAATPKALVIFDSEDLKGWWTNLATPWKEVLRETAGIGVDPTKDDLAKVTNLDSINISANTTIRDIRPLNRLDKLQIVIAHNTTISDLSPLSEHREIRVMDISDTQVEDISALSKFNKLKTLRADRTKILSVDTLASLNSLKFLYVDETSVDDDQVEDFLSVNPRCLVVYKSNELKIWWSALSEDWKTVFRKQLSKENEFTREELHQLVEMPRLQFSNVPVNDLSVLASFVRLSELHFSGTNISSLGPLSHHNMLRSLHVNGNPIRSIGPLANLKNLQHLDISNTPVAELDPLGNLKNLKELNCSSTQVKKLNALSETKELDYLDCSNTDVKKLKPVISLSLTTLKCSNTKISKNEIGRFKSRNPECNVTYYR